MQVCTSFQTDNHASTPTTQFTGQMPFLPPNQQHQSTEGIYFHLKTAVKCRSENGNVSNENNLMCGAIITAWCYASTVLAMGLCPFVCLSVCLSVSVTSRSSTKTAKQRITQTTPHDNPVTLVFWCQRSPRNSTAVTPYEGAECRWGGSKSATFD